MRILVIGASGLVGSHLLREAKARGHVARGTFRRHPAAGLEPLDLADRAALARMLDTYCPDWVIHAAGWTWVDGCEDNPEQAMEENANQPAWLARACQVRGTRLTYVSTTYVFDGRNGPYREAASPSPINVYGRSKLAGEIAVQTETGGAALILRTICVWGIDRQRKNFVYQAAQSILAGEKMRLPADQFGNPTWAGDIAIWTMRLMADQCSGVWNVASPLTNVSRVDWFRGIFQALQATGRASGSCEDWFVPETTAALAQKALRPLQASVDVSKLMQAFPLQTRHYTDIQEILTEMVPSQELGGRSAASSHPGDKET